MSEQPNPYLPRVAVPTIVALAAIAALSVITRLAFAQAAGAFALTVVMPTDASQAWAIRPIWTLSWVDSFDPEPTLAKADGRLVFIDAGGAEVSSRLVARNETCDPSCSEADFGYVVIPALPAAMRAELYSIDAGGQKAQLMASRDRTARSPGVALLHPEPGGILSSGTVIDWVGVDLDGDPLSYDVLLRPSSGALFQIPLRTETTANRLVFDATGIPADDDATLVVLANDGFDTSEDQITGLHIGGNHAPEIYIVNPLDGQTVAPGSSIALLAVATDVEDKSLPVHWQSSLDGAIAGSTWRPHALGQHLLTATVTDSGGYSASAQVRVTVDELAPTPGPPGPGPSPQVKVFLPMIEKRYSRP